MSLLYALSVIAARSQAHFYKKQREIKGLRRGAMDACNTQQAVQLQSGENP
jgi:hypothetical protein